jgi:hypothetical protein
VVVTSAAWPAVRLRQVVVVTRDLEGVTARLRRELDLPEPFVDPGVGEFGLENRVLAAGRDFLEVLTPVREGTAGGRHLERRGGDSGYMAIFELGGFAELAAARSRVADLGMRIVWQADLDDIAGTHLHPADVGAAIVSLDAAVPPESWHWAGPSWRGGAPAAALAGGGGIASLTVAARDPLSVAERWAAALGVPATAEATIDLPDAGQVLRFVASGQGDGDGVVGVGLRLPGAGARELDVAGVRVEVEPVAAR